MRMQTKPRSSYSRLAPAAGNTQDRFCRTSDERSNSAEPMALARRIPILRDRRTRRRKLHHQLVRRRCGVCAPICWRDLVGICTWMPMNNHTRAWSIARESDTDDGFRRRSDSSPIWHAASLFMMVHRSTVTCTVKGRTNGTTRFTRFPNLAIAFAICVSAIVAVLANEVSDSGGISHCFSPKWNGQSDRDVRSFSN